MFPVRNPGLSICSFFTWAHLNFALQCEHGHDSSSSSSPAPPLLHIFKLVNPSLGVALPDLPQGLVLVPALLHVLLVDPVHRRLAGVIPRGGEGVFSSVIHCSLTYSFSKISSLCKVAHL